MMRTIPSRFAVVLVCSAASFLASATTRARPVVPTEFVVGEKVATDGTTNVRATADGPLLGTQKKGAPGTIISGPVSVSTDQVIWYKVDFASLPSGWVGGDMLVAAGASVKPVVLGTGTDQTLILDEFGNIDVAWYGVGSTYQFTESLNQGASFSTPVNLPMSPVQTMSPLGPSIAAERSGAIDVVFLCQPPGQCPGNPVDQSLELIRSTNNGATWSSPVMISLPFHADAFGASEPVIAACGVGVTVVWQDDGVGANFGNLAPDIILEHVIGGVPGAPINLSKTVASEGHPQIAVNAQSTVFVTWVTDNGKGGGTPTDNIVFAAVPNCGAVPPGF